MMAAVTTPSTNPSTAAARVLVQALAALGVRDVVLAPGSRSAPLAFALAAAALPDDERPQHAPALRLHVRVDERDAAFLALGMAKASPWSDVPTGPGDGRPAMARPVAVVTTSGTAVANLHPAVLEAHHAGVPLLLLTADRPHELRGTGANQTTEQPGMFGSAVRLAADVPAPTGRPDEDRDLRALAARAVAAATGARTGTPGPVHLDLAFREPLVPSPDDEGWPTPSTAGLSVVEPVGGWSAAAGAPLPALTAAIPAVVDPAAARRRRSRGPVPTVVVAGDGAGPAARQLAEAAGWPLLAEPSSGARAGSRALTTYRLLLDDERLGGEVRRVVVLGRPTLSRPVQRLLADPDVEVAVIAPRGAPWPDAARNAAAVLPEVPARWRRSGAPQGWWDAWRAADQAALAVLDRLLGVDDAATAGRRGRSSARLSGPAVARAVAAASSPADVLVAGSSNPVRDLDLVARWETAPLVLANRGLAGIDGTISTAAGTALALPARRVRAYVGDLTFLHDVGGLLRGPGEPSLDLQVVVANDDGGSVFSTLEPGAPAHAAVFERVFGTPHGADLAALCAGYGVRHTRVSDLDGLLPALAAPGTGLSVVEVRVDRAGRRALGERIAAEVAEAVRELLSS
ncbi:MAG: 2-succinyl-5-enolpyruvyl-6-hydroxy-3-cyclohexene-1-carboxylic-acid synthase [Cellulomonas sp. 73-145]|nr:MAG: 2-succinyl-5-enolpyruvyl-6-hydroxy-3-cyclohexene-1-carboxylic-acid synthase [Cellulomonas sp. 73-145]